MRWLALLPISFLLTGCYSDQKQQVSSCELEAKQHVAIDEPLEIQDNESSEYIELCMQAHGYEVVEDDCPRPLQSFNSIPKVDPDFYRSLGKEQKDNLNVETGKKIMAIEELQKIQPACYEPMGWFSKKLLRFERYWGEAPKTSN